MAKQKSASDNSFDFEKALAELEQLVEQMEQGDLSLEESLKQFERGIALTRACQQALQTAEQKVQILLNEAPGETGEQSLTDFDDTAANSENNNQSE